jgi:hypothetical protein
MSGLWNQYDSKELEAVITENYKSGDALNIQTSEYAYNTTAPGFRFDEAASAPAVRALINKGILTGECGWRYYAVEVV